VIKLKNSTVTIAIIAVFVALGVVIMARSHASASNVGDVNLGSKLAKPNIVYILTDDQTMESVAKMPYVSSRTDWISFDHAYINNGLCCPSRATILTGRYDTHTGVGNNAQGSRLNEAQTLPVWLSRAGYQSGLFGKYLNQYPFFRGNYVPPGWNDWQVAYAAGPQWQIYPQYHWKLNSNGVSSDHLYAPADYQVTVLANKMKAFINAKASAHQPFFAEFTPSATHAPWKASPTREGTLSTAPVRRNPNFNYAAANQPAYIRMQPALDGSKEDNERRKEWEGAASVDDAIRSIDNTLKTAGVFNNTVEIFMTDNGYSFGDHRWERKRCEYNECGRTPLLVRYPGLAARHDAKHMISNVDIASTISQIAGATPGIAQDGRSFLPLILGQAVSNWRSSMLLHWPGGNEVGLSGQPDSMPQFWGVLADVAGSGQWKYVEIDTGERELYNETADPNEMHNLAGTAANATIQAQLKSRLAALKSQANAAAATGNVLRTDMPTRGKLGPDLD
jgi:arylsulfatase A-like enzyme